MKKTGAFWLKRQQGLSPFLAGTEDSFTVHATAHTFARAMEVAPRNWYGNMSVDCGKEGDTGIEQGMWLIEQGFWFLSKGCDVKILRLWYPFRHVFDKAYIHEIQQKV